MSWALSPLTFHFALFLLWRWWNGSSRRIKFQLIFTVNLLVPLPVVGFPPFLFSYGPSSYVFGRGARELHPPDLQIASPGAYRGPIGEEGVLS